MVYGRRRKYGRKRAYRRKPYYRAKRRMAYRARRWRGKRVYGRMGLSTQVIPSNKAAILRYSDVKRVTTDGVTLQTQYTFRANSIYDPDYTGGGHQPMGYDTYAQLYNKYTVVGSKITVRFCQLNDNKFQPAYVGIYLDDATTPMLPTNTYVEAKKGVFKMYNLNNTWKPYLLQYKFSAKRMFGITNIKDKQGELGAGFGANPTLQAYFNVWFRNSTTGNCGYEMQVIIEYMCLFDEPAEPYEN